MYDCSGNLKIRVFAAAAAGILAISAGACAVLRSCHRNAETAVISVDGNIFGVYDLSQFTGGRSTVITVPSDYSGGSNTVEISNGRIRVIDATCPDKICIHQGERGAGCADPSPITCLPNRMTIATENNNSTADAVSN